MSAIDLKCVCGSTLSADMPEDEEGIRSQQEIRNLVTKWLDNHKPCRVYATTGKIEVKKDSD